jgi:hypothetical protein
VILIHRIIKSETYRFFDDFSLSLSFKPEISSGAAFLKKITTKCQLLIIYIKIFFTVLTYLFFLLDEKEPKNQDKITLQPTLEN